MESTLFPTHLEHTVFQVHDMDVVIASSNHQAVILTHKHNSSLHVGATRPTERQLSSLSSEKRPRLQLHPFYKQKIK